MKPNVALDVFSAVLTALLLSAVIILYTSRPPDIALIFDDQFFWAVASLLLAALVVAVLVWRHKIHTGNEQLFLGLLLIALSAVVYATWEQVQTNTHYWSTHLTNRSGPIALALVSASLAKNLISFGFAALGAGIAAGVITRRPI